VAADPAVLPQGTVIRVERAGRYDGVYRVLDTGANIRGRRLDLFMRNCREAIRFGRRDVGVITIR
jgi:3D (Asp-Asp-Asp) domain-containing protein